MKGWLLVLTVPVVALLIAGGIGWAIGNSQAGDSGSPAASTTASANPVDPHVAAGAHNFVQFACSACHGALGKGDVSADVPALTTIGRTLTSAQLRTIIDKGVGVVSDPKKPFMPAWGPLLSERQVNDLVSYLHAGLPAVADATPVPVPAGQGDVVAGSALYVRYGCVNCHGPNGLGGVPNPASPDKTIPPLSGADFRGEFNTDAKIAEFIVSGSVLGKAPLASMPHWGGILPPAEVSQIVAYINTLR
jgi:mono/diheme cytochrome c family protein